MAGLHRGPTRQSPFTMLLGFRSMSGDQQRTVANKDLDANRIPREGARWDEIGRFALIFDGYGAFHSVERLGALDAEARCGSLTELRGRLFFHQRYWKNDGGVPRGRALIVVRDLLAQIRQRVELANALLR